MQKEPLLILLAEDNKDHAELVIRNLHDCRGIDRIVHVEDGEEALSYLYNRGRYKDSSLYPTPQLLLLDLRLPKIDGLEVLKIVKGDNGFHKIPVVVLTTSSAEKDLQQAYNNHANSFLVKPVTFKDFAEMLKDLGDYWLGWNKQPSKEKNGRVG